MKPGNVIVDLLGRKLRVESYSFELGPDYSGPVSRDHCLTRDRKTCKPLLLARLENGKWEAVQHNLSLGLYVRFKLTFLEYLKSKDMRYQFKH